MDAQQLLTTDAKLIFELAARMDPPAVIAEKYGLDPGYVDQMLEVPHVKRAIADKRAELESQGFVLAQKAKLMFEDLLPDIYKRSKADGVTLTGLLDAAKFLRQVAGLDRVEAAAGGAPRFSITINIPQAGPQSSITIEHPPIPPDLPLATPAYLTSHTASLGLEFNADLSYA